MSTIGTATNSSPYLAAPAAAAIENGKNHFVTLGENGVSLATAGAAAVGILLPDTEGKVAAGECVTVQIKDRTLIQTGGAITAGDRGKRRHRLRRKGRGGKVHRWLCHGERNRRRPDHPHPDYQERLCAEGGLKERRIKP